MSVKDIIKSSVYDNFQGGTGLSIWSIMLILFVSCLIGLYIFMVYKGFSKSSFYSKDLNISIACICIIVSAIMIAMQSNLLVSLGMVGALSIVRFRTAIKNPMDLVYMFWSISVGIICGVGLYILAVVLCIIMTLMIWLLRFIPNSKAPILLIMKMSLSADKNEVDICIKKECSYFNKCSVTTKNGQAEVIYEVRIKEKGKLVSELAGIDGVLSVSCLEHDGEIRV